MSRVPPEGTGGENGQLPGLSELWTEARPGKRPDKRKKTPEAETEGEAATPSAEAVSAGEAAQSTEAAAAERHLEREAAAQTLRRRVELADLYNHVPPAERGAVLELQASLARYGGDWHLEQGRLLYNRIVREEVRQIRQRSVKITHRFAWRRDPEAHRDPHVLSEEVSELLDTEQPPEKAVLQLAPLRERVSPHDTVLVHWRFPGRPETVIEITARDVTLRDPAEGVAHPAGTDHELARAVPSDGETVRGPDVEPEEVGAPGVGEVVLFEHGESDLPGGAPETPPAAESEPRAPLDQAAETGWMVEQTALIEMEDEPGYEPGYGRKAPDQEAPFLMEQEKGVAREVEAADYSKETEPTPAGSTLREPRRVGQDEGRALPGQTKVLPEPGALPPLRDTLETLSAIGDRAVAETLPPVAGGSGEGPGETHRRRQTTPETPLATHRRSRSSRVRPAAQPLPSTASPEQSVQIPPSRGGERIGLHPERVYPAERLPSARLRRKARKLARILARRYHVRLTPELEAYLVALILRPQTVNGRRVIGLGVNRDQLLKVLSVLWLNFGDLYVVRPKPPPSQVPPAPPPPPTKPQP